MAGFTPDPFPDPVVEEVCRELGEAMNGSQLGGILASAGLPDERVHSTKWKRLHHAVMTSQVKLQNGRPLIALIHQAMAPARFGKTPELFEEHRESLNVTLSFYGLSVGKNGRVKKVQAAQTLDEAHERANALRTELLRRNVHPDVLKFCHAELLQENYFHAVLEASKSVAQKIRDMSGFAEDGAKLVDVSFSLANMRPPIAFNKLQDPWEQSEHSGLAMLAKGMFGTFRNPTAHAPRVHWAVELGEALDLLTLASMLHRRLDQAIVTPAAPAARL